MSQKFSLSTFLKDREFLLFLGLFILLFSFLIGRVIYVPLVYDEIHTKWVYMIEFNPLPYMGYVDANNHFLNSFLGGVFYRLFDSDANWVFRLGSLLSFPIYFWSVFGFRSFFDQKYAFRLFAALFLFTIFILEYFGLARGYGMSIAFLMLALQQTFQFVKKPCVYRSLIILIAWLLAIAANLTLLPFAMFGLVYIATYSAIKRKILASIIPLLGFGPILYFLKYSFHLRDIGKLYYGGQEGFFENTVHSITNYTWGVTNGYADFFLGFTFLFIIVYTWIQWGTKRHWFNPKILFAILLLLAVLNIVFQNILLGINFPEDRSALYLLVFFFGALAFFIDFVQLKSTAWVLSTIPIVFFFFQMNFTHSIFWFYEHFDSRLLTEMNSEVQGIPPSTGGRFWSMDNELTRTSDIPGKVMQDVKFPQDSILDYIVTHEDLLPKEILPLYKVKFEDNISGLKLFERNHFLNRKKVAENEREYDLKDEYVNLLDFEQKSPVFVRVSGYLENMNIHRNPIIVVSADNREKNENLYYTAYNLVESLPIDENGRIYFDITFGVNSLSESNGLLVYHWNKKKFQVQGKVKVEIYEVTE